MQEKVWKYLGFLFLGSVAVELSYRLYKRLTGSDSRRQTGQIFKALFFPDHQVACRTHFTNRHGCTSQRCRFSHDPNTSYAQLLKCLCQARRTLDICVYTLTCQDLAEVVIQLHHRGVVVRIITDDEQIDCMGSQIGKFRNEGIQVRNDQSPYFVHHKFAILDGQILMNGSFNWTRQAITGNQENILLTNHSGLVKSYSAEFEKLWREFDPVNYKSS